MGKECIMKIILNIYKTYFSSFVQQFLPTFIATTLGVLIAFIINAYYEKSREKKRFLAMKNNAFKENDHNRLTAEKMKGFDFNKLITTTTFQYQSLTLLISSYLIEFYMEPHEIFILRNLLAKLKMLNFTIETAREAKMHQKEIVDVKDDMIKKIEDLHSKILIARHIL